MKKFFLIQVLVLAVLFDLKASGVCIVDAFEAVYFNLLSNKVYVVVNDQIATVKTTQEYRNLTGSDAVIKYAFPLNEEASATNIRWKLGGTWYTASISPSPQDTTLPGGGGGGGGWTTVEEKETAGEKETELYCSSFPNPYTDGTTFTLKVDEEISGKIFKV